MNLFKEQWHRPRVSGIKSLKTKYFLFKRFPLWLPH